MPAAMALLLDLEVGEPVAYVQVLRTKGLRNRVVRFTNSPITKDQETYMRWAHRRLGNWGEAIMKVFLSISAAILIAGFIVISDIDPLVYWKKILVTLFTVAEETNRSPWAYAKTTDPLTDNVIESAYGKFFSDNGFTTQIKMSCESSPSNETKFRLMASFFDQASDNARLLKVTPNGYAIYSLRFGTRPPVCIKASGEDLPYSNSILINLGEKRVSTTNILDFYSQIYKSMLFGSSQTKHSDCGYRLLKAKSELKEWLATADMALKVRLRKGEATFLIDTAYEIPRHVLKKCETALGASVE